MAVLDTIFRIVMFLIPFAICFAGYWWVAKKAWKAPRGAARIVSLLLIGAGLAYTLFRLATRIGSIMTNDNFEFVVIIVSTFVLFFAAIALAIAEPEIKKTEPGDAGSSSSKPMI